MAMKKMSYYVVEFTNSRSVVLRDIAKATGPIKAADQLEKEHGGIVYSVDGPFETETAALDYLDELRK